MTNLRGRRQAVIKIRRYWILVSTLKKIYRFKHFDEHAFKFPFNPRVVYCCSPRTWASWWWQERWCRCFTAFKSMLLHHPIVHQTILLKRARNHEKRSKGRKAEKVQPFHFVFILKHQFQHRLLVRHKNLHRFHSHSNAKRERNIAKRLLNKHIFVHEKFMRNDIKNGFLPSCFIPCVIILSLFCWPSVIIVGTLWI